MEINGQYNSAITMIDNLEDECISQIIGICNLEYMKDSKIRIMSDAHAGKGICVGFTATMKDKVSPNFCGVDISCSVSGYKLSVDSNLDCEKLDKIIRQKVPSGMSIRQHISKLVSKEFKESVYDVCQEIGDIDGYERHIKSLGTLGGGNHMIEINKDKDGYLWLVIHCGSRNFGHKICMYHQDKAIEMHKDKVDMLRKEVIKTVAPKDREEFIRKNVDSVKLDPSLAYLEGDALDLYVKHMKVAQEFAKLNHKIIAEEITDAMGWVIEDSIVTNHNYIEFLGDRDMIIRKGAVSAKLGERLIVPMNMQAGSLILLGKGNDEWNCSAPHGAGRILSRSKAKDILSLGEFKDKMKDVWTSCVSQGTLDESPMAYKNPQIIIDSIQETADIIDVIIPLYNFKAN